MTEQEFDSFLIDTNKVGAKNLRELNQIERDLTQLRIKGLSADPISGKFDYDHLKEIHKFIFQDVYDWAGKDRNEAGITGNFYKGSSAFVPADKLGKYADEIFTDLKNSSYLKNCKDVDEFLKNGATQEKQGGTKSVLERLGDVYFAKLKSREIKAPETGEKSKERER